MWNGIYSSKSHTVTFDDTYWKRQMKWLKEWEKKCDEQQLVEVASGIKSAGRDTFREP